MFFFCSMDSDADMMERHARLLGRFADQAAMLAEDLCAAALAAPTAGEKQSLSLAFHRMGRTLRQTLALEAKLRRDARRREVLEQDRAGKAASGLLTARRQQLSGQVQSLIWDEAEDEDHADTLKSELEDRLEIEALDVDAFLTEPLEDQIARLCDAIGLPRPLSPPPTGSLSDPAPLVSLATPKGGGEGEGAGGGGVSAESANPHTGPPP